MDSISVRHTERRHSSHTAGPTPTTPQAIVKQIVQTLPLARMGTPEDLAGMCLFLLSDEASWITGQIFNVDGGQIIRS